MTLQRKIAAQPLGRNQRWHDPHAPTEFPIPAYGAHDLEPPANREVWHPPRDYRDVTVAEVIKSA